MVVFVQTKVGHVIVIKDSSRGWFLFHSFQALFFQKPDLFRLGF